MRKRLGLATRADTPPVGVGKREATWREPFRGSGERVAFKCPFPEPCPIAPEHVRGDRRIESIGAGIQLTHESAEIGGGIGSKQGFHGETSLAGCMPLNVPSSLLGASDAKRSGGFNPVQFMRVRAEGLFYVGASYPAIFAYKRRSTLHASCKPEFREIVKRIHKPLMPGHLAYCLPGR